MDRKYILSSLVYAVLGMTLGIYMAATKNHGEYVTHAHILLAGFVVSFIYGLCHKLWLNNSTSRLAQAQFYLHQARRRIYVGRFVSALRWLYATRNTGPDPGAVIHCRFNRHGTDDDSIFPIAQNPCIGVSARSNRGMTLK